MSEATEHSMWFHDLLQGRKKKKNTSKWIPEYLTSLNSYWKLVEAPFFGLPKVGHLEMFFLKELNVFMS